jgi:hypothetical protein
MATGKSIDVGTISVFEIAGEKDAMQRQYFDIGRVLQQIGIIAYRPRAAPRAGRSPGPRPLHPTVARGGRP